MKSLAYAARIALLPIFMMYISTANAALRQGLPILSRATILNSGRTCFSTVSRRAAPSLKPQQTCSTLMPHLQQRAMGTWNPLSRFLGSRELTIPQKVTSSVFGPKITSPQTIERTIVQLTKPGMAEQIKAAMATDQTITPEAVIESLFTSPSVSLEVLKSPYGTEFLYVLAQQDPSVVAKVFHLMKRGKDSYLGNVKYHDDYNMLLSELVHANYAQEKVNPWFAKLLELNPAAAKYFVADYGMYVGTNAGRHRIPPKTFITNVIINNDKLAAAFTNSITPKSIENLTFYGSVEEVYNFIRLLAYNKTAGRTLEENFKANNRNFNSALENLRQEAVKPSATKFNNMLDSAERFKQPNPYYVLHVDPQASKEAIELAYYELADEAKAYKDLGDVATYLDYLQEARDRALRREPVDQEYMDYLRSRR